MTVDVTLSTALHGEVIYDKSIYPRRKNICGGRVR
jgi:hypothetical protein